VAVALLVSSLGDFVKDSERISKAMALKHSQLLTHWKRLQNGAPMNDWGGRGYALEYLFLRGCDLELKSSREVRWPFGVTSEQLDMGILEQIDGVVYAPFAAFLVESKCLSSKVDVEPLAKLRFRLEGRPPLVMGVLISHSGFTEAAQLYASFATPLNVLLWTAADIEATLPHQRMMDGMKRKFRHAVERKEALLDLQTDYTKNP
jgi:hypothetical protein